MKSTYRSISNYIMLACLLLCFGQGKASAQSFVPKNVGDSVNSIYFDVNPVLSHGGDTLFFSRINDPANRFGRKKTQDIWMSVKQADGSWGMAERLPNSVNLSRNNALYGALEDGKTFLIEGVYDRSGTHWLRRGFSFIKCDSTGWSKPVAVKMPGYSSLNEGDFTDATITPDGRFIFIAFSKRFYGKNLSLYVSERRAEGKYSKPVRLEGPMNDFYSAEAPHYNKAENRLYFSGRKAKEVEGGNEIYYVTPVSDDKKPMRKWENLSRLSDTINTAQWESYWTVAPNGNYALYCSNNLFYSKTKDSVQFAEAEKAGMVDSYVHDTVQGVSDIFKVMLIEERPWVKVTGRILNALDNKPFSISKAPEILVNGVKSDSVLMDVNESTFFALMPLGHRYVFSATAPYYTGDSAVVDMTGVRLYKERDITLKLKSFPYVQVSGSMMNNLSLTSIPASSKPVLIVDGKPCDSVKVDPRKGGYVVNLPYGRKYTLSVKADNYESIPLELDLTKYNEFAKAEFDVFAKPLNANMVTLKGKFINTKTGKPLEPGHDVKMRVNRIVSQNFKYNDKTATYSLMLPVGVDYDLVPVVKNFYNKLEPVNLTNARPRTTIPRDFFVTPLEVGQSVDIENIYFETAKSNLRPESFRSLNALVDFFNEYPNVKVQIGGHTDNKGGVAYNKRLSKQRAQAVADYMIQQGISRDRFEAVGFGPDKPKASNKTAAGRAKNRRVDFTIMAL